MQLGHGDYHKHVPRELKANLAYRLKLLRLCRTQPQYRHAVLEMCRRDIVFFINVFVWQINPKKKPGSRVAPFITWDIQDVVLLARPETHDGKMGILWCYEHDRSAVVEKSREMGATWLFMIFQAWLCLFTEHTITLNISRNEPAVIAKHPNSLFGKLAFLHKHIPSWLAGEITESKSYFEYHNTSSYITAQASTGDAGIGDRASLIFVDEFPRIKDGQEVRVGTASTADCRFFNGTHQGKGNEFYQLTHHTPEIAKVQMHWTQHPDKVAGLYRAGVNGLPEPLDTTYAFPPDYQFVLDGSPNGGPFPGIRSVWYDKKSKEIGHDHAVAQELDIDPTGSVTRPFSPLMIRELIGLARDPWWQGDLVFDRDMGHPKELAASAQGPLYLWLALKNGKPPPSIYTIGCDPGTGLGATPSCATIFDALLGKKVGEFTNGQIYPDVLAAYLVSLARLFVTEDGEPATLIWEVPGPGLTMTKEIVHRLQFPNYYKRKNEQATWAKIPKTETAGWPATPDNQRQTLESYEIALRNRKFINHSRGALEECLDFKYSEDGRGITHDAFVVKNNAAGTRVNHGDHVVADSLAWLLAKGIETVIQEVKAEELPRHSLLWRRQRRQQEALEAKRWI